MMDNRHVVMMRVDNLNPGAHLPLCGDDSTTKETVTQLLRDCGWVPTDAGALSNAAELERAEAMRRAG
jgi:predicted dinucleotide-binding enzyme